MHAIIKPRAYFLLVAGLLTFIVGFSQANQPATDFLTIPGPIVFDNNAFSLSWSSHPSAAFYKQEYLVKGDNANRYKKMVLIDALTGNVNIKDAVGAKVNELKKMKESNPVINYEVIDNPATGEYILDFLLTANAPDGSISIVERNVYRYKACTDKAGNKIVLLFGISTRAYGTDVTAFITTLKTTKKELVNKVAKFKMPGIIILK